MSDNKNNGWISVDERTPTWDECAKNDNCFLVYAVGRIHYAMLNTGPCKVFKTMTNEWLLPTHWMELPDPPPRKSSFDQWFERYPGNLDSWTARHIWNSAIEASKKLDYVP